MVRKIGIQAVKCWWDISNNRDRIEFSGNIYGLLCYEVQAGGNKAVVLRKNYGCEMNFGNVGGNTDIAIRKIAAEKWILVM